MINGNSPQLRVGVITDTSICLSLRQICNLAAFLLVFFVFLKDMLQRRPVIRVFVLDFQGYKTQSELS